MIAQELNFYSLLIPILMFIMGMLILLFHRYQALPQYLLYFAISQIGIACSNSTATLLAADFLSQISAYAYALFFTACVFHLLAIHHCARVKTQIAPLILLILTAFSILFYFSVLNNQPGIRIFVAGITLSLLYSHHAMEIFKKRSRQNLDVLLKILLILMIIAPVSGGVTMYLLYPDTIATASNGSTWAAVQFALIVLSAAFLTVFVGYVVQSSFMHLRKEYSLDPLTGLSNRRALHEHLADIRDKPITQNALLICDLDHFKQINDQYGHYVGDLALKHVSRIMIQCLRQQDEVSRYGGEEFIVILHDVQSPIAHQIAERIRSEIALNPLYVEGQEVYLTISIGLCFFYFYTEFEQALQTADQLMYQAKDLGRNRVQWEANTLDAFSPHA